MRARRDAQDTDDVAIVLHRSKASRAQVNEAEEADSEAYSSELSGIAVVSRENPDQILPLLLQLITERAAVLQAALPAGSTGSFCAHCIDVWHMSNADTLVSVYEELHWLLLIAGNVLGDACGRSEIALVPSTYDQTHLALREVTSRAV